MRDQSRNLRPRPETAGVAAPASRPSITVAICTRNRAALLEKAVRSVLAQANHNMEILIVDNGSTDGTAELAGKFAAASPRVRAIRELQTGLSIARNTALREAKGDWVIFLDDDATAEAGWLAAYGKFFSNPPNPHVACVGGPVLPDFEMSPPPWLPTHLDSGGEPTEKSRRCRPGESLAGCNYAVRRDLGLGIGGFNTSLGHRGATSGAYEEVELTERFQQAGRESWWLPDARIKHFIAAERLQLRWQIEAAFRLGRCAAIRRLGQNTTPARRALFTVGRMLIAPPHCGLHLLVVLVSFPVQNGRIAVKSLMRASSIAGFAREALRQL